MNERRFEGRFLCADLVRVDWLDNEGADEADAANSRTAEAVLEDISALGACVQVDERIACGAAISISTIGGLADPIEAARFSGWVSYCVYRDYGYFIGIRFSDETPWSTRVFAPRHLTSLEALLSSTWN